jgi:cell division protein FtsL
VQSSNFAHTGQKMQQLEAERVSLKAEVHDLEGQVASLSSLERTQQVATQKLGMIRAHDVSYLSVGVEAPEGALLPRPLVVPPEETVADEPWWESLYKALPLP